MTQLAVKQIGLNFVEIFIPYMKQDKKMKNLRIEYCDQINEFMPMDKKIIDPKDSDDSE